MPALLFSDLATVSADVSSTRSRKKKISALSDVLRGASPLDVRIAVAYLSGVLPQGKIGIGYKALQSLQADLPERSGRVATLAEINSTFTEVKQVSGKGSVAKRAGLIRALLTPLDDAGRSLLGRLIVGEVRQGALEGMMADAVSAAFSAPAPAVRRAAMLSGDLPQVAERLCAEGASSLDDYKLIVMRAVQPMLAHTADDVAEALDKLEHPVFEHKLDGARVQVHKQGHEVRVFSRNLNDVTPSVPEVVEAVRGYRAESLILDGETLALRENGRPHPFQVTMRRYGRSLNVNEMRASLPLTVKFFDVLHADEDVLDAPARERFALMRAHLHDSDIIPRVDAPDAAAAERFYREALDAGHEGIVAKDATRPYEAGKRGASWLKVKRVHTLDLVVLAVDWGSGRRKGFLSNLHLGARDERSGEFVMLGKTFKGMTDAMLKWQTEALLARAVEKSEWTVRVRPELVVEIAFDGLQESPHYAGGLALRFARVKRYREDKTAAEADTFAHAKAIFDAANR